MFAKNKKLISVGAVSFFLSCLIYYFGFFASVQEKIYDKLFVQSEPKEKVIIVAIDDVTLEEIGPWPMKREYYGKILNKLEPAKIVAFDILISDKSRYGDYDDEIFIQNITQFSKQVIIPLELRDRGGVGVSLLEDYGKHVVPVPYANVLKDYDGVVRNGERTRDNYSSFACRISGLECWDDALFRINYLGKEKTFLTFSFVDVLNGKVPESVFEDSYVLIGVTSNSLHDIAGTPFGDLPGVEVHANILHTILSGSYFMPVSGSLIYILIFLINALVLYIVLKHKTFTQIVLLSLALFVLTQGLSIVLFNNNILLPQLYTGIALVVATGSLFIMQYVLESKEKRFIEDTFKYYLMPDVIEDLKNNPHKLKLGGEMREVTILFSDIRGFTTISEKLSPEELTRVINEYLTAMTDIIMEEGGLVDKYIGDAIMAFWGAPVDNSKQAECAGRAVIKMSEKLKEMNIEWAKRGVPELGIGIGLNKGQVIVGNMGSAKRFNYTIMGDEVNFGSRLEGLNKKYGTECIVSESVAEAVKDNSGFIIRKLDRVLVKGKKEPKNIYELVSNIVGGNTKQSIVIFEKGFEAYAKGDWKTAEKLFRESLDSSDDKPSQVFLDRVLELKVNPPESWQGVYEHTSK